MNKTLTIKYIYKSESRHFSYVQFEINISKHGDGYYINITFPDMVIVENIIPRNVIINQGAAEVDNHISRYDIFDYHHIREGNIYFIIPNIRSFIFHCLRPTMVRGDPTGK